ncbi:penicillin-binding protein activator LpoB [Aliivibrio finisterrensis]|uniref:Penicillin-binding protein activator LpoB n=1 Tax=Aliivibrio finisterrensis TaxID=511998 RepID=A0A6N6RWQ3_9GAMM|nr:penicillin-binding protein activator LpoB [Aliivibrio finisterrensis]KAB2826178.1 penicillin-binding protein activator LpoB [Aliivibrio finisterrensis]
MKKLLLSGVIASMMLSGCQLTKTSTSYIDAKDTTTNIVATISYADFNKAATELADEIIASPGLAQKDGSRTIVLVDEITNDTMQRIDTDQLTKGIRVKLLQSGLFAVTTAFGEDDSTRKARSLKDSELVNQKTVKKSGTVLAADYSLSGKIIQRNATLDNDDTRIEYYFQLTMTNLEYGVAFWEGERVVGKVADGSTVSW